MIQTHDSGAPTPMRAISMSNKEYHADTSRISKSGLDIIAKSPLHYWEAKLNPKRLPERETPALIFGRAAHLAILEPMLLRDEFAIEPEFNLRTNQGKADYQIWLETIGSKSVIDREQYDAVMRVRDAVHRHPAAAELLNSGKPEQTFVWTDQDTGAACKLRADWITSDRIVTDIKTTEDASPEEFGRSAAKYRYHVQGAYYTDGLEANGFRPEAFVFVAVEKKPPFAVAVYFLDNTAIERGREIYKRDLGVYTSCRESGIWHGYSNQATALQLPSYALK